MTQSVARKLLGKVFIQATLRVKTGLHIGSGDVSFKIGGVDNPVVKNPITGKPYVPGSSIKGKIRSLLEASKGKEIDEKYKIHVCSGDNPCEICKLFGRPGEEKHFSSGRLIVRDATLIGPDNVLEEKAEVSINRKSAQASNLRVTERVAAGAEFGAEFILNVFDKEDIKLLKLLKEGMDLLEKDYLGGSGTRGYGQVEFKDIKYRVEGCNGLNVESEIRNVFGDGISGN